MPCPESQLVATMTAALHGRSPSRTAESLLAEMVQDGVIEVVGRDGSEPMYDLAPAYATLRTLPHEDESETDYGELMAA